MPVIISMLRGINVGGRNQIKMDALRALYDRLGLRDAQTYVQSGNVIFLTGERNLARLAGQIRAGIEQKFKIRCEVILRTAAEMKDVVARNPFAGRSGIEPGKLLVTFLAADLGEAGKKAVREIKSNPEELHLSGRELIIYFPNGAGRSKLPWSSLPETLGTRGTARNWNTVLKMLEIAEKMK